MRDLAARRKLLVRLASPFDLAAFQLLLGRRDHEDEDRVGQQPADLFSALHVDLEHEVAAACQRTLDTIAESAVKIAAGGGLLASCAFPAELLELPTGE